MIFRHGQPIYMTLPRDLVERMLEYVIYASAVLSLLVTSPGKNHKSCYSVCLGFT
jgi:hypothetical protein